MADVIVVAGTSDAREIVKELARLNIEVAATVTTGFGGELIEQNPFVEIFEGKLTAEGMAELINKTAARCLIDASHPYAKEASANAIEACQRASRPYLRYERKETAFEGNGIIRVKSYEEAAQKASEHEGNIFLATGSNSLEVFVNNVPGYKDRLFVRVLPDSRVIEKCEKAGLSAKNIIAMKGPFSEGLNVEMLKHCRADVLVTKDSGDAGGAEEKLRSAERLGIPVIVIERPEIEYIRKVDNIKDVLDFVVHTRNLSRESGL